MTGLIARIIALTLAGLFGLSAQAAAPAGTPASRVDDLVSAIVVREMERDNVPGLQISIAKDGHEVFAKSFGTANVELGVPASRDSLFEIGSVTKVMTGVVIMKLAEDGTLHLGDSVRKYFPEAPESWAPITISQLLRHTAGLPDYTEDQPAEVVFRSVAPVSDHVAYIMAHPLMFPPGTKSYYSNANFLIASVLAERASHKTYPELLKTMIFDPCGMSHTRMENAPDIILDRVAFYSRTRDHHLENSFPITENSGYGAGALLSTADDLTRFMVSLLKGSILTPASVKEMFQPVKAANGRLEFSTIAWSIQKIYGQTNIIHRGVIPGGRAILSYFPDAHLVVSIVSNQRFTDMDNLAQTTAALYAPGLTLDKLTVPQVRPMSVAPQSIKEGLEIIAHGGSGTALLSDDFRKSLRPSDIAYINQHYSSIESISAVTCLPEEFNDVRNGDLVQQSCYYKVLSNRETSFLAIRLNAAGKLVDYDVVQ